MEKFNWIVAGDFHKNGLKFDIANWSSLIADIKPGEDFSKILKKHQSTD